MKELLHNNGDKLKGNIAFTHNLHILQDILQHLVRLKC